MPVLRFPCLYIGPSKAHAHLVMDFKQPSVERCKHSVIIDVDYEANAGQSRQLLLEMLTLFVNLIQDCIAYGISFDQYQGAESCIWSLPRWSSIKHFLNVTFVILFLRTITDMCPAR